jgi:hypothetical protein
MNRSLIVLLAMPLVFYSTVKGQNNTVGNPKELKGQIYNIQSDTVLTVSSEIAGKLIIPEIPTEYTITGYKNVDFAKTDPFQLETAGLHPEVYISNTHHGVIIIISEETNGALKDFRKKLEINPNYFETLTRQDTLIFPPCKSNDTGFDFTKVSSISHNYKNAFNYAVDPHTGVSWSKGSHKDFLQDDALGKVVYDLIIVISKSAAN